jgi:hypothetical protein
MSGTPIHRTWKYSRGIASPTAVYMDAGLLPLMLIPLVVEEKEYNDIPNVFTYKTRELPDLHRTNHS